MGFEYVPTSGTKTEKKIFALSVDTVIVQNMIGSSHGFFKSVNGNILFFDRLLSKVTSIDKEGAVLGVKLDVGEGPKEIPHFTFHAFSGQSHFFISGYTVFEYDADWSRKRKFDIKWFPEKSLEELEKNPKPWYRGIYEIKYLNNEFIPFGKESLIFNIESTHPLFNGYFQETSENYYKNARVIGVLDLQDGKIVGLEGRYPSYYRSQSNVPNFSYYNCDASNDKIYINFNADSLIYVLNSDFDPIETFGVSGVGMGLNYLSTYTYEDAVEIFQDERCVNGFYSGLKYFEAEKILFRTYYQDIDDLQNEIDCHRGEHANTGKHRMQIYMDHVLIGDVEVPNRFSVFGKIDDTYYADGLMDEEAEKLGFYRFKLDL